MKETEPLPDNVGSTSQKPDKNLLVPTLLPDFSAPVGAFFVDLSQMSMQMIPWQWHEEIEFFIVNSGHALLKLPDRSALLSPGEGVFLNQNQLHSIHTPKGDTCSVYTLKFHPSFLFGYGQTHMSIKYLTPVLSSPALHSLILHKDNPDTADILSDVKSGISCCRSGHFGYELEIKSILCRIWYRLLLLADTADSLNLPQNTQAAIDNDRIKQAILFIEEKHMDALTLDEIAASIHVSKSECCRCFQRALGVTPFEYLMKYRIFESTRKMMRGDPAAASISTLAASVGFNSPSYYNKLFKKYMNCTPTEYKKSIQNKIKANGQVIP